MHIHAYIFLLITYHKMEGYFCMSLTPNSTKMTEQSIIQMIIINWEMSPHAARNHTPGET